MSSARKGSVIFKTRSSKKSKNSEEEKLEEGVDEEDRDDNHSKSKDDEFIFEIAKGKLLKTYHSIYRLFQR